MNESERLCVIICEPQHGLGIYIILLMLSDNDGGSQDIYIGGQLTKKVKGVDEGVGSHASAHHGCETR